MHIKWRFLFSLLLISISHTVLVQAQLKTAFYTDWGKTNVSEGLFIKTALLGQYTKNDFTLSAGIQTDVINPYQKIFTGAHIHFSRAYDYKQLRFEPELFYLLNSISSLLNEHNAGVLVGLKKNHFSFKAGTHFRNYRIRSRAAQDYGIEENRSLLENWNFLYLVKYTVMPDDNHWNAGISVTNIDYFLISQETNPEFSIYGNLKVSDAFTIFSEAWYKPAGAFNISVNYFGFFIRTGIIWQIH